MGSPCSWPQRARACPPHIPACFQVTKLVEDGLERPQHVIMNLPAIATEFLGSLKPWLGGQSEATGGGGGQTVGQGGRAKGRVVDGSDGRGRRERGGAAGVRKTRVHCYCFSTAEDLQADGRRLVEEGLALGEDEGAPGNLTVHVVRYVAPLKAMLCVEFDLP